MTSRHYIRSSLARSVYERILNDERLRTLDKSQWYQCDLSVIPDDIKELFVLNHSDQDTEDFLDVCYEKSDWMLTQIFHALAKAFLCWFMTRTSVNGLLGRGSMFVYSSSQFETLLNGSGVDQWRNGTGNLLDLGAGDGKVTDIMARYFHRVYVTEISQVMQKILASKGYNVLEVEEWYRDDVEPKYFDVITCLNVLDRCDLPLTMLRQMRQKLKPNSGRLVLALVLPLNQYVESGRKDHQPSEKICVNGGTFEQQVTSLTKTVFPQNGFQVVRWSRLPYLCEGDMDQSFYWLDDAIFVLQANEEANNCDAR